MNGRPHARYPNLQVSVRSRNPLVLVAAVREELRLAKADPGDIARFTEQAMAAVPDPDSVRRVVAEWTNDPASG